MIHRPFRRLTTMFFVVFALLFSQLALAGYVCPAQAKASAMAEMVALGEPCEGMDQAQPVLCHQHFADAAQSFEAGKLPAASVPPVVQMLAVRMVLHEAVAIPVAASPEAQPPPDPIYLSTLRLRV